MTTTEALSHVSKRIERELQRHDAPAKFSLTVEINRGTGGAVNTIRVKTFTEEEMR